MKLYLVLVTLTVLLLALRLLHALVFRDPGKGPGFSRDTGEVGFV